MSCLRIPALVLRLNFAFFCRSSKKIDDILSTFRRCYWHMVWRNVPFSNPCHKARESRQKQTYEWTGKLILEYMQKRPYSQSKLQGTDQQTRYVSCTVVQEHITQGKSWAWRKISSTGGVHPKCETVSLTICYGKLCGFKQSQIPSAIIKRLSCLPQIFTEREKSTRKSKICRSSRAEELMSLPSTSWTVLVPEKLACDVYIGCMPLRVPALAPKALPAVLARLGVQHFYTLLQEPSADSCMYYDFLPANPEDPRVIAALLSGRRVNGIVQERKLQRPPRRKCWWVGKTAKGKGFESAGKFNTEWDTILSLFHHDCRHYTNDLVQDLTGKKDVISRLDVLKSRSVWDMDEASISNKEN